MQINRPPSKRKILYILLPLLVFAVLGTAYFLSIHLRDPADNQGINYKAPSQDQVDAGSQIKRAVVENNQNTGQNNNISVRITLVSVESDVVHIRNTIEGVHQEGMCKLILSKKGQTVKKTADIQPLPQNSTCKGFDIPVSELSSGTWQVELNVMINNETTRATTDVKV